MRRRYWLPAFLLASAGAGLWAVYSAMRFSAALLLAVAAALLLWGFLAGRREKAAVVLRRFFLLCLAAGAGLFAVLEAQIVCYGCTDETREVSAVVILGAGVNGTVPSLSLQVRLEAAVNYLRGRPEIPVVVTGSQGPGEAISEAECMAEWLNARGIERERILLEEQADNTRENIEFSRKILADKGIDLTENVAVVTADYHLYRASLLWSDPGMVPVAAHMPGRFWGLTANYYIREAFAVARLLLLGR